MTLCFTGVDKAFAVRRGAATVPVLEDLSLRIGAGEFVSLVGHSGCGKSTLLNLAAGLLAPDAGTITADAITVTEPGPDRAVVFQQYSLLPRMSLYDNVLHAVRAARPDRTPTETVAVVDRYVRAVGLWEHRHKRPGQVSGGMKQRAAVARAFAVRPRILLLDEPFGALDALTRARLQQELVELWQQEDDTETVVMVTHGIDEAVLLADRVVVIGGHPGPSILADLPIPFERPRDRHTTPRDPRFQELVSTVLDLLERDAA